MKIQLPPTSLLARYVIHEGQSGRFQPVLARARFSENELCLIHKAVRHMAEVSRDIAKQAVEHSLQECDPHATLQDVILCGLKHANRLA